MKKGTIVLLSLFLVAAAGSPALAARSGGQFELDGSFAYATGPANFDDQWGFSFGGGYMMNSIENLEARIDISYFPFERGTFGGNLEFKRLPIAVGARYYIPVAETVNIYAEGAVEASFDNSEYLDFFGLKHTDDEVNVGFTPGVGAEFFVNDAVSLFAGARYHVISEDYLSVHLGGALHF